MGATATRLGEVGWGGIIVCCHYKMRIFHVLTIIHVRAHSCTESKIPEP